MSFFGISNFSSGAASNPTHLFEEQRSKDRVDQDFSFRISQHTFNPDGKGTRKCPYKPFFGPGHSVPVKHISASPIYRSESIEELRLDDYKHYIQVSTKEITHESLFPSQNIPFAQSSGSFIQQESKVSSQIPSFSSLFSLTEDKIPANKSEKKEFVINGLDSNEKIGFRRDKDMEGNREKYRVNDVDDREKYRVDDREKYRVDNKEKYRVDNKEKYREEMNTNNFEFEKDLFSFNNQTQIPIVQIPKVNFEDLIKKPTEFEDAIKLKWLFNKDRDKKNQDLSRNIPNPQLLMKLSKPNFSKTIPKHTFPIRSFESAKHDISSRINNPSFLLNKPRQDNAMKVMNQNHLQNQFSGIITKQVQRLYRHEDEFPNNFHIVFDPRFAAEERRN